MKMNVLTKQISLLLILALSSCLVDCKVELGASQISAVSTQNEACKKLANRVLQIGGNAVDSAILATACLCVYEQQSTSFGGSGFATIYDRNSDKKYFYDMRPFKTKEVLIQDIIKVCLDEETDRSSVDKSVRNVSPDSVAFPLILKGFHKLSVNHGRLATKDLFQLLIDKIKADDKKIIQSEASMMAKNKLPNVVAANFAKNLNMKSAEEFYTRNWWDAEPFLKILEDIQNEGLGEIASSHSKFTQEVLRNSSLTLEDFKINEVKISEPYNFKFRGYNILAPKYPSGGLFVKLGLELFEKLNSSSRKFEELGHNDLVGIIISQIFNNLQVLKEDNYNSVFKRSVESIVTTVENIDIPLMSFLQPNNYTDRGMRGGTSHVSVIDDDGLSISITTSVNRNHGSGVMLPSYNIILNDDNCDYADYLREDLDDLESQKEFAEAHPELKSSMSPIIFYDENTICSVGSKGSQKIFQGVIQVVLNYIYCGMSLQDSLNCPRIYYYNNEMQYEHNFETVPFSPKMMNYFNVKRIVAPGNRVYMSCKSKNSAVSAGFDPRDID
ncbi:MAG: hypothetical protein MHMPM18_000591 [Marteilia pararefringens]